MDSEINQSEVALAWNILSKDGKFQPHYFAKMPGVVAGGVASNRDVFLRTIQQYAGYDTYVCLNPAKSWHTKPTKEDITDFRMFLIDIDPITDTPQLGDAEDAVLSMLTQEFIPESNDIYRFAEYCHRIDSGRGLQLWVPVICPGFMRLDPEDDLRVKGIVAYVERNMRDELASYGCKIDTSCAEISRVARLPGTINTKTGRRAKFLSVADGPFLTRTDLDQFIRQAPSPSPPQVPIPVGEMSLMRLFPMLNRTAFNFITQGVATSSAQGRHADCYATAKNLKECGVTPDLGAALLCAGASLCRPPLPIGDIERVARQVWGV